MDLEERVVGRVLESHAMRRPDQPWMLSGDGSVTYGRAWDAVNRIANSLDKLGLGARDVLAIQMEPSIELVLLGIAASRLGALFTTISTDFTGAFLQENLHAAGARMVAFDAGFATRCHDVELPPLVEHVIVVGNPAPRTDLARYGTRTIDVHPFEEMLAGSAAVRPLNERFDDRLMAWWSSGTTGKPKGILHNHATLIRAGELWNADRVGLTHEDVYYTCLPMYLGGAWTTGVWPSLVAGARVAIDPRFSVTRFWDRTRHYGANHIVTLGAMHIYLMEAPPRPDDRDNPVRTAAPNPMPWHLVPKFKERFGIDMVVQMYGQSEVPTRILWAPDDGTNWRQNAIGRPVPWLDVQLVDEFDRPVADGEVGEIVVRPKEPYVLYDGYLGAPEFTISTWRNLWHHTGDLARRETDGQYFFADRRKDYIRHKGRNISMTEVEQVLQQHPAVREVAAFGVTAEIESEAELAVAVSLSDGMQATHEELARFVNDNAPYYFVPRYLEIMDDLPHNAQFKLNKLALRERGVTAATWDRDKAGFEVVRR
jgi:carnitine-CoA ligase